MNECKKYSARTSMRISHKMLNEGYLFCKYGAANRMINIHSVYMNK